MALPFTDREQRLIALTDGAERRLREALRGAILAARDEHTLAELARLMQLGQFDEAVEAAVRAGVLRLADEYSAVYVMSGQQTAGVLSDALEVAVGFDQVNERAVLHMRRERLRLIREFTAEQRRATRAALVDGIERGLNPRDQARLFRASIGLTERQVDAVNNYRRMLEAGDGGALSRRLHDHRFLPKGSRARREFLSGERPLTPEQVDRMVGRYRERYVRYRSEVVARTEALRAVHSGNEEMYRQAIDAGQVALGQLRRTWVSARDERVRGSHAHLNGEVRGMDETWVGTFGELRFPGDPDAPPEETVQCRCVLTTRIARPDDD